MIFLIIFLIFPVVPFRETIVEPPETDMVNEEVNEENKLINNSANKQVKFGHCLKHNILFENLI